MVHIPAPITRAGRLPQDHDTDRKIFGPLGILVRHDQAGFLGAHCGFLLAAGLFCLASFKWKGTFLPGYEIWEVLLIWFLASLLGGVIGRDLGRLKGRKEALKAKDVLLGLVSNYQGSKDYDPEATERLKEIRESYEERAYRKVAKRIFDQSAEELAKARRA